jgi:hypothetical protein
VSADDAATQRSGRSLIPVAVAACAACCAPLLPGALAAIGIAGVAGFVWLGAGALLVAVLAAVALTVNRRRRQPA